MPLARYFYVQLKPLSKPSRQLTSLKWKCPHSKENSWSQKDAETCIIKIISSTQRTSKQPTQKLDHFPYALHLFISMNRLMFLPEPAGLIRAGSASGYKVRDPGNIGTRSANAQYICTTFGWGGNAFLRSEKLQHSKYAMSNNPESPKAKTRIQVKQNALKHSSWVSPTAQISAVCPCYSFLKDWLTISV